jgi:hypothetical protein
MFSMSAFDTIAPKSMLDLAEGEMGVTVIWDVIVLLISVLIV